MMSLLQLPIMKIAKRLIASLLLSFCISTMTAPKAYSGVGVAAGLFAYGTYKVNHNETAGNWVGPVFLSSWGLMATGFVGMLATGTIGGTWSLLFFLDAEGNLPQENVELGLATKFPFLDNQETINSLSKMIKDKYELSKSNLITLTEAELNPILESTDLSNEQYEILIKELK